MILSYDATLTLMYKQQQLLADENRFKINSKIKSKCLKCFHPVYIGYFEQSVQSIFCEAHKSHANNKNIVQLQYLRIIKEKANEQLINE